METNSLLYSPLTLRGLTLENRLIMSPMCQYSAVDGLVGTWHRQHYIERAKGGVGMVMIEATAVQPRGRISPRDLGLWNAAQRDALKSLVEELHSFGVKVGIQLAHAGRKASTQVPWIGTGAVPVSQGGWPVVSSGSVPFEPTFMVPEPLDRAGIEEVVADFASAAIRAVEAGVDAVEIHGAHGYLIHQFLSPLINQRTDAYGGSQEGRFRLATEITRAIRRVLPTEMPLFLRLSGTEWAEGGWSINDTVALLQTLKTEGVDFADISSGGGVAGVKIPFGPGYQVPFAAQVKHETGLTTGAVGMINDIALAEEILNSGQADAILMGRILLRDPYFPLRHAPAQHRRVPSPYFRAF